MKNFVLKSAAMVLALSILLGVSVFAVDATETPYPESEHDYRNDYNNKWFYKHSEDVDGLYVTFSKQTSFEEPSWKELYIEPQEDGELTVGDVMDAAEEQKSGDYISISSKNYTENATGKELSGKTIYIPGNFFYITLQTDESVTDYGFSIDRISDTPPEDVAVVTYEICEKCNYKQVVCYNPGDEIAVTDSILSCKNESDVFVCWVSESGKEYYGGEPLRFESAVFKAKTVPLLLGRNETLKFGNDDWCFDVDKDGGYYLTPEDYYMMQQNIYKVFGVGVIPAVALSIALYTYPDWHWQGSCYGMSTVAFLQHYGVIDLLEDKPDAKGLVSLKNDAELVSAINYYQWSAAGSFLCENFALEPGTEMYSLQLKNLFETVSNGNIVLFTYYPSGLFEETGHTILMTGAYTQPDGTHVLVAYDCNYPEDYNNGEFEQRFYIDPDYTSIKRAHNYPAEEDEYRTVGAFNWTDDYEHFKAFDINGKSNVITWYLHFFSQMFRLVKTALELTI